MSFAYRKKRITNSPARKRRLIPVGPKVGSQPSPQNNLVTDARPICSHEVGNEMEEVLENGEENNM